MRSAMPWKFILISFDFSGGFFSSFLPSSAFFSSDPYTAIVSFFGESGEARVSWSVTSAIRVKFGYMNVSPVSLYTGSKVLFVRK